MSFLKSLDLEQWTGLSAGVWSFILLIGIAVLVVLLVFTLRKMSLLTKRYDKFMEGKNAQSLENVLLERIKQVDHLVAVEDENKRQIQFIMSYFEHTYQKIGVVKYDAFDEMGGKLSFTLAMLNRVNDGFILNAMHSREGCFTYIKEIVNGKSIILLSEEEEEALNMAIADEYRPRENDT